MDSVRGKHPNKKGIIDNQHIASPASKEMQTSKSDKSGNSAVRNENKETEEETSLNNCLFGDFEAVVKTTPPIKDANNSSGKISEVQGGRGQ